MVTHTSRWLFSYKNRLVLTQSFKWLRVSLVFWHFADLNTWTNQHIWSLVIDSNAPPDRNPIKRLMVFGSWYVFKANNELKIRIAWLEWLCQSAQQRRENITNKLTDICPASSTVSVFRQEAIAFRPKSRPSRNAIKIILFPIHLHLFNLLLKLLSSNVLGFDLSSKCSKWIRWASVKMILTSCLRPSCFTLLLVHTSLFPRGMHA